MDFRGQGLQLSGGSIHINRDFNIGALNSALSIEDGNSLEAAKRNRDDEILRKLRSTDPHDDKTRIELQKGGLLADSYKWVLGHEDFKKWHDGGGNQILWVRGDPGKGKTMLLCGIINELKKASMRDRNVVYFFCQATDARLNNAISVLRGLMFSLLSQQQKLLDRVRDKIDQAGEELFQDINGWAALCNIFHLLLEELETRTETTYLIVDAMDECLTHQNLLLKWIADLSSSRIKCLVSSRNWPSIENTLRYAPQLRLELNTDSISAAVDTYIDDKVAKLAESKGLDFNVQKEQEIFNSVQEYLKSNSNNTFLWVALVLQQLDHQDVYQMDLLTKIKEFPPQLNELYQQLTQQVLKSNKVRLCRQILAVQLLAYRPLSLAELFFLVEIPDTLRLSPKERKTIVELCGSLLTIVDNTVYFVHQSAKDYLIEHASRLILGESVDAGHYTVMTRSIQVLSNTFKKNMCELPSLVSGIDTLRVLNPDPLDEMNYTSVYWADHLESAKAMGSQGLKDGGLVHMFFKKHLFHWLKALNLYGRRGSGIEALTKVLSLLQESQKDVGNQEVKDGGLVHNVLRKHLLHWLEALSLSRRRGSGIEVLPKGPPPQQESQKAESALHELVYDALRVSRQHQIGIETSPLQVYEPGLVFSPTSSVVRKLFLKPKWLLMSVNEETDWSPCIQELNHSIVHSMAFSPNGRYLVSGANDSTAKIWDVGTGVCLYVLDNPGRVTSVAFSPNNKFVASSSARDMIRIWDATTGVCLRTLKAQFNNDKGNNIVVFPNDESVILVHPTNSMISKWNTATGARLEVPHISNGRESMCVSHNGRRAAWVLRQKRAIEVVDFVSGQSYEIPWQREMKLKAFEDDNGNNSASVALSSDGELVVAAVLECGDSDNKCWTIKVCDVATSKCIRMLHSTRPLWNSRLLLALSPDHRYLVARLESGSDDGIGMWRWDIATGQREFLIGETNKQRQLYMNRLQFSPNGKLMISLGSVDGIMVWEMKFSVDARKARKIRPVKLSKDHKLIVKTGQNDNIEIWDLMNKKCLVTVESENDWPRPRPWILFSPNSTHIACIWLSTILLFDAVTGHLLWESRTGYKADFRCKTYFSTDGRRLASAFLKENNPGLDCDIIQVLDTATGTSLGIVPVANPDPVELNGLSFAFLPNGTEVATTYYDSQKGEDLHPACIRIWDIATGSRQSSISLSCYTELFTFSPDGRHIAYTSDDDAIRILEVATGNILKHLERFWDGLDTYCMRWGKAGLLTDRGIYGTQALLNDSRSIIPYGLDNISVGALSGIGMDFDDRWILKNGERYIRMPQEVGNFRLRIPDTTDPENAVLIEKNTHRIHYVRFP
ncbi:hypothetical protein F5B18DRAFT_559525 [Nemania serpens]|nr:hypothetical protein F5B18DRAFT_559525 [Nemania serpens]